MFPLIHGLDPPASTARTIGHASEVRVFLGQEAPTKTWADEKWFRDRARCPSERKKQRCIESEDKVTSHNGIALYSMINCTTNLAGRYTP